MKRFFLLFGVNILIVVVLSIILAALGISADPRNYGSLLIFCFVWGMGGAFISLFLSKWMAKMMMGVEIVDQNGSYRELVSTIHTLARKAGLSTMPEVGVYQSPEMNAFATGPSKNNSLVAVSSGIYQRMSKNELEGVLAHEVAHIANGDMITMTLIQGVMNAFVMFFARIAAWAISQGMRNSDDDRGPSPLVYHLLTFLFEMVFGILASIALATFSRHREFKADAGSARLAGKDKMISALEALSRDFQNIGDVNPAMRSLQISSKGSFMALFSTHPPLEERIAALKKGTHLAT